MKKDYKPKIYVQDIFSINYKKLSKKGINTLFFDIDNTIAPPNIKYPDKKTIELFNKLKKEGFNLFIITNALKRRALRFEKALDTKTYYFSCKPLKKQYIRIIEENQLNIKNIAAIGDQLTTDINGANKMNILSILVNPISKKESILTKINRLCENSLIKKYKIIEKGNYYE